MTIKKMIFTMELCDCVHDVTFGISYQVFCFDASIDKRDWLTFVLFAQQEVGLRWLNRKENVKS
jgi:hypothetical protein